MFDTSEQDVLKYMRLAASGERESSRVAKNPVFLGLVDDEIQRRAITLGPIIDGLRVIRKGLVGDETLVIQGLLQARPDSKVEMIEGTIEGIEDGLPDDYQPVPKEQWISPRPDPLPEVTSNERCIGTRTLWELNS